MTRIALLVCIGLCTILPAVAAASTAQWVLLLIGLGMGAAWLVFEWRGSGRAAVPGMVSVTILSAVLAISGPAPLVMVLVAALALSAWDLSRFRQRLVYAAQDDMRRSVERRHLRRLLFVNIMGFLPAILAVSIRVRIDFYVLLLVGGVSLLAIYWMLGLVARMARKAD
ncbi:MAG: hypothetical protein JXB30_11635 [Anaerolineae bacterium]|nr:hypothetical protein [Anaerolineae bacterium]